jgi:ketosteroid isomerase-like protein
MTQVSHIIRESVLSGDLRWADRHLADDGVFEFPFAAPGRAKRYEGKAAFLAMAGPARAALPFTFDTCEIHAVHRTADPEVAIVEYEIGGPVAGAHRTSSIIAVLRVRDGKVVHWREYQDTFAILQAVGRP